MHVVVVGASHRSAPIAIRERLAFSEHALPETFEHVRQAARVPEVTVLSTCNRVEIYAAVPELNGTIGRLQHFLSRHGGLEPSTLAPRLYAYTQPDSVQHLFSVASGLDSMVVGEHEILSQVKQAYESARTSGATGKTLNALFQRALNAAKTVRSRTAIGQGSASVGSVAVDLVEKIFGEIRVRTVLLIGAGSLGELALRRLVDRGVREVRVLNRSMEHAEALAKRYAGVPLRLEQLGAELVRADVVVSSVSVEQPLLTGACLAEAMRRRRQRPLCVMDLGVPRNVEPQAGGLDNVYLFNVDDLERSVALSLGYRRASSEASRQIIAQKVDHFVAWLDREGAQTPPACGRSLDV